MILSTDDGWRRWGFLREGGVECMDDTATVLNNLASAANLQAMIPAKPPVAIETVTRKREGQFSKTFY